MALDPFRRTGHCIAMETTPTFFTGQLLLALPGIGDPRVEHAVIAMISHDEDGAMGIGIADPIAGMTVGAVLDQLEIDHDTPLDQPVFLGAGRRPLDGVELARHLARDRRGARSVALDGRAGLCRLVAGATRR